MQKKTSLLLVLFVFICQCQLYSQNYSLKAEEIDLLFTRPLLVSLIEPDKKKISGMKSRIMKAKKPEKKEILTKKLAQYNRYIENYNSYITSAVNDHWTLNENVEFKPESEIKRYRNGSRKYTILWNGEHTKYASSAGSSKMGASITLPIMHYSRGEKSGKPDYNFYLPLSGHEKDIFLLESELILTLKLMQNHLIALQKTKKKKYLFKTFSIVQAKANCDKLENFTLKLDRDHIFKNTSIEDINTKYVNGKVDQVSDNEINDIVIKNEDELVSFVVPFDVHTASNSAVTISMARGQYLKLFVNAKTGVIFTSKGSSVGEMYDPFFRLKPFSKYGVCK